ncbi:MAG: molybdopterin-guanine dinucleotide biosynthesis protein MobA [Candidatus Syntrophoarchaeum sp. GoM_oil]|nr:MAG: molybdopterin-guanine dinucleotide biosynthesis protein MobA [Candidatus Syntrophoarchaeum sp. GoM_oil]
MRTTVILAGGTSSRFGFRDKSLIKLDGEPLLVHVIHKVKRVADEVVLSFQSEEQAERAVKMCDLERGIKIAIDCVDGYGPIAGINAAMKLVDSDSTFIVACDMPNLNTDVIELLFNLLEGYDAVVPIWENGYIEGLHSVYTRGATLRATEECIRLGERKLLMLMNRLNVRYVPVEEIRKLDPRLLTFSNINSEEDLHLSRGEEV